MSFSDSPSSFRDEASKSLISSFRDEELLFKNVPEEWLDSSAFIQRARKKLEESLVLRKEAFKSFTSDSVPKLQNLEDQVMKLSEDIQNLKNRKNSLSSNIMNTKMALNELEVKKKMMTENDSDAITQEELSEMLKEVLAKEAEHEHLIEEMKKNAKVLVGQMCFYKEYLDVYVDIPGEEDYVFYFRKCNGKDSTRPKEWIRIRTENFKEYYIADVSLPEESIERKELMDTYNNGIPLRNLVLLARKKCLEISDI